MATLERPWVDFLTPEDLVREVLRGSLFSAQAGTDTVDNGVVTMSGTPQSIRYALAMAGPEVAWSHLVDEQAQLFLMGGQQENFLQHRAAAITAAIARDIADMAEWGARDGQAIADLIRTVPR